MARSAEVHEIDGPVDVLDPGLYTAAMHECSHLVGGGGWHDEGFAATLTTMIRRAAKVEHYLKRIRDVVVKRR
jgi:hypothetical protein